MTVSLVNRYAFCFVFDRSGKVLVLKRADFMRKRPGEWDLPGGRIHDDESLENGVEREVSEETGLKVSALELVTRGSGEHKGETHEFSYFRSIVTYTEISLSEEHTEYEWHEPLVASTLVTYKPHIMGLQVAQALDGSVTQK